MILERGKRYTVHAIVTNLSTAGGQPVAAVLTAMFMASADSWSILPQHKKSQSFAPGETRDIPTTWPLSVPANIPPSEGEVRVYVYDPDGKILITGSLPISIP